MAYKRQLIEAMKRHSPAQTTKMDLGDRLESLELKLHLKEKEVTELRATIEQNETNLQAVHQRCERLNINYDRERKVASGLKADNARLTGELQKDKSASNKFREEARKKRGALQQCIAVLQGHVKACKSDLEKAKKANSAEMAQYEDCIHSMKVQLKKKWLTAVESESEVAIRKSRELTEENKQVWMESKDVHHTNVMLRQKLLKLDEQALEAQGEVQRLEQLLQSRNKELDSVKDEIDNVTTQHQETLLTVEQLQDSLCTKKEELQAATENVSSLRTSLQERTDELEKQLTTAEEKSAFFEQSYNALDKDLTVQKEKCDELQMRLESFKQETKAKEDELKCFQLASLNTASKFEQQLSTQVKSLEGELKCLKGELRNCEIQLQEAREEDKQQKAENKSLVEKLTKAEADGDDILDKHDTLVDDVNRLEEARDSLVKEKNDLMSERDCLAVKNSSLKATEQSLREEADTLVKKMNSLLQEKSTAMVEVETSFKQHGERKKTWETTEKDLGDRLESLGLKLHLKEAEVTQLRATIERNETIEKDLGDRLESLGLKMHLKEEEVTQLRATIRHNEKKLEAEMGKTLAGLETVKMKFKSDKTELEEKIALLQDSNRTLETEKNELEEDLKSRNDALGAQLESLKNDRRAVAEERDSLRLDMARLVEEKVALKEQVNQLEDEKNRNVTDAQRSLDLASTTKQSLQASVTKLTITIQDLTDKLSRREVELNDATAKYTTTKMDLGDRLESLELKLRLKEEEVTKLRATIERNEVRIQDAKEELRDLEKYRKRVQELRNQLREANTKASEDKTTISELETKRNSQTTEESQQRQDIEGPLLVEINTLKERLSQRETDLQSSNGRISELERDIDASKAHSAELQSELKHTSTELTSTLAELNNTHHDGLKKAQEQNEASSSRCQELEQQCQELRQHIAELESAQNRLQKREEDLNQQVEVLKFERDTAQRQAQDFDRDGRDFKLKLQKTQSDYENEQRNCDRERDTTQGLRTEISQLIDRISSLEREVQALKEKGRHRREVMQQMVKLLQTQVAAVRSDLDQERSRQSDLKDSRSAELLLTRFYIVRSLKTELVSRAAELQKCRDELKTTTAERNRLNQSETSAASQVSVQQQLHQFQEHVTQSLGQVHDRVAKVAADVSAVPELNRGVQQLHRQMSSSSSLDQSSMSGQQLTSRSQKLESAIDSDEHLDPDLMTSDASSDVPITGQQRTLSLARLQPTPEEDPGLETVTSIASDLPDNGNGHHQLSPDSSPSSVDPHTTEVTTSPNEERDLVAGLSRPTGPEHEMRTNSPDVSRMDRQPAISHYRQPSASDHHQPSVRNRHQPSISDRHQPSVNDRDPQSFRDHPPRPWSEDNMDPLPINGPNPSLPTRIAGQRTPFSNVVSYSTFPFQTNLMPLGGFHLVPVPMSFPNTSVMPIHDDPSPMSLPSSSQSGSSFPMHGGRDSSLSATVATSLQDSVDPALLKKRITKLSELMPYVPDLAHKVPQIAGYLDMYTKLQALKQTCSDPEIHLQELLSQWLEGQEDEERPHYWKYFITLVKAVDQYPVVRRIYIDLAAGQAKS